MVAAGAGIAACTPKPSGEQSGDGDGGKAKAAKGTKGSETKPLPPPKQFGESPELAKQVKAGSLPPVEDRLPAKPYVVPHRWVGGGKYGGTVYMVIDASDNPSINEFMYGRSPLRWLNDGLDIGPGVVESWDSNPAATEWTLHIRENLKWSDGQPVTSADVMYWWEDMVLNEDHPALPGDAARSGTGSPMRLEAPDKNTLVLKFDAATPLTPALLANGVNTEDWFMPRHYLEQFHPKYNKKVKDKNWMVTHDKHINWVLDPKCPTLAGWRTTKFAEGRTVELERNPYYWCVDKKGDQLPYLDKLVFTVVDDTEVAKLQIQEGKIDYVHGPFVPLGLADIAPVRKSKSQHGLEMQLWDSGSGTASVFFLNYDYPDAKLRKLIREPKFRQALSHAFNRDEARKAVYFNTGEKTTGTYSPKAIEYVVNGDGKQAYKQWRDAYVEYDPEKAKKLLDELGVVDKDGDGKREVPGGGKLTIRLDVPADIAQEHKQKNEYLKRDWEAIGLSVTSNPIAPASYSDQWKSGVLMSNSAWEVGDGPDHITGPWWFVPIEPERWAPLHGQMWSLRGTKDEKTELNVDPWKRTPPRVDAEPGSPIAQLWDLYAKAKTEVDALARHKIVWEMIKLHIEYGPFFMGVVANYPQLTLHKSEMGNVPARAQLAQGGMVNTWAHPTPACYDPEVYFWDNPEEHT
ncbi:ABC transporter substrate-binding protein [Flindersiella endophytica]